jgi:phospholipid-binding lipoprotein MlaA
MQFPRARLCVTAFSAALLLCACAINGNITDPLEPLNRGIYKFNDAADKAVVKPVARAYRAVTPAPVRTGVGNFFSNLGDVLVTANDLLQFKFRQAATDATRVLLNSTFGVAGLFDVATPAGLEQHNEDFGQTLGYWGMGPGAYLMLPLLGPSTLRDTVGRVVDNYGDPVTNIGHVPTRNSGIGARLVDRRAGLLDTDKLLEEAALDPYVFLRDAYLQRRRSLVYDGNPPPEEWEDEPKAPSP